MCHNQLKKVPAVGGRQTNAHMRVYIQPHIFLHRSWQLPPFLRKPNIVARIVEIVGDEVHARRFKLRDAAGNELDRHITGIVKLELN